MEAREFKKLYYSISEVSEVTGKYPALVNCNPVAFVIFKPADIVPSVVSIVELFNVAIQLYLKNFVTQRKTHTYMFHQKQK